MHVHVLGSAKVCAGKMFQEELTERSRSKVFSLPSKAAEKSRYSNFQNIASRVHYENPYLLVSLLGCAMGLGLGWKDK